MIDDEVPLKAGPYDLFKSKRNENVPILLSKGPIHISPDFDGGGHRRMWSDLAL